MGMSYRASMRSIPGAHRTRDASGFDDILGQAEHVDASDPDSADSNTPAEAADDNPAEAAEAADGDSDARPVSLPSWNALDSSPTQHVVRGERSSSPDSIPDFGQAASAMPSSPNEQGSAFDKGRASQDVASRGRRAHSNDALEREIENAIAGLRNDPAISARAPALSRRQKQLFEQIRRLAEELVAAARSGSASDEARATDYAIHHRDALITLGRTRSPEVISTISQFTRHREPDVRIAAATGLGHTAHPHALPPLLRMLRDDDLHVLRAAVDALGQFAEPRLVRPLMALAQHIPRMTPRVFERVCAHDELARQQLLDIVCNRHVSCLRAAARALIHFPDDSTVKALGSLIESDQEDVAVVACASLKAIASSKGVQFLKLGLVSQHARVRYAAADALQRLQHSSCVRPLIKLLDDELPATRLAAARALGLHKDSRAVGALAALLRGEDRELKLAAIEALGRIGDPAAGPTLVGLLRDPDDCVPALLALKQVRRPEQRIDLTTALNLMLENSAEIRRHAIGFLGRWGDETVVPQIGRCLLRDPQTEVRVAAARALGELKSRHGLAYLRDAIEDELDVRCQVASALGNIGDASVRPLLERLVRDPAPQVVYHAISALGGIGARDSADVLVPLLDSSHAMVAQKARRVLLDCGDRRAAETLTARCRRAVHSAADRLSGVAVVGQFVPQSTAGRILLPVLLLIGVGSGLWLAGGAEDVASVSGVDAGKPRGVAFGPGETVFTTHDNGVLLQWSSAGEPLRSESLKLAGPILVNDAGQLVLGQFRSVLLYDPAVRGDARVLCELEEPIQGLEMAPDHSFVVAYGNRDMIAVLDAAEDYRLETLDMPIRVIATVSVLPGPEQILVGEPSGVITIWRLRPLRRVGFLSTDRTIPILCSDVDAKARYAVFGTRSHQVLLFTLSDSQQYLLGEESSSPVTAIELSRDGSLLAAGDAAGGIRLWTLPDGTEQTVSDTDFARVDALRLSEDGSRLLAASNEHSAVLVIDPAEARVIRRLAPR